MDIIHGSDPVVAPELAGFGLPEARVERLSDTCGVTVRPRETSHAWPRELLVTRKALFPDQAQRMALVNRVTADDEVEAVVRTFLADVLLALRATMPAVQLTEHLPASQAHLERPPALAEALASEVTTDGERAFSDGCATEWNGR